jgi:hypothetical protein
MGRRFADGAQVIQSGVRLLVLVGFSLVACRPLPPPPEGRCVVACEARAKNCDEHLCERGCRFALDRLVEHEGDRVVECVARAAKCDDETWAECSVRIGVHADGGPPAPGPPHEEEE